MALVFPRVTTGVSDSVIQSKRTLMAFVDPLGQLLEVLFTLSRLLRTWYSEFVPGRARSSVPLLGDPSLSPKREILCCEMALFTVSFFQHPTGSITQPQQRINFCQENTVLHPGQQFVSHLRLFVFPARRWKYVTKHIPISQNLQRITCDEYLTNEQKKSIFHSIKVYFVICYQEPVFLRTRVWKKSHYKCPKTGNNWND